ncbi:hypothetical protein [Bradyrhizobium sp. CCGUVB14]|uniref:hypothetical protein n=1 Tax=Bradyrhizobium sp. CCGUVB14 TaxID=2949628 RepID=UPI0020B24595|nr:hypothetical protein [Bradyrhizobium sp. CCGUVB14]MCP3444589.1 hypothetical protein [Bradyrhizobium sp. CCGUVB14]
MRMKITSDATFFTEELRLRDPDAFVLLELCHFDHGESVFELRGDEMRRDMPAGSWSDERFYGALSRLIAKGCMVAVRETIK